jgi:4-hydroxy-tetrahydrodipicolinate synthase
VALWQKVLDNHLAEARATFLGLVPLINTLFMQPNPAPVKAALAMEGLIDSELRAPMQRATEAVLARLNTVNLWRGSLLPLGCETAPAQSPQTFR